MARTMGELLPASYAAVFGADDLFVGPSGGVAASAGQPAVGGAPDACPIRVFVDVGSGYGSIVRAAVESGGFDWGIGIEKYR